MRETSEFRTARRKIIQIILILLSSILLLLAVLIRQNYNSLEREAIYNLRSISQEIQNSINLEVAKFITPENERDALDYSFYNVSENSLVNIRGLKFSPLSNLMESDSENGLIGYFQVAADGNISSPILPETDLQLIQQQSRILSEDELIIRSAKFEMIKAKLKESSFNMSEIQNTKLRIANSSIRQAVLARKITIDKQDFAQGLILDPKVFFENIIRKVNSGKNTLPNLRLTIIAGGKLVGGVYHDKSVGEEIKPYDWLTAFKSETKILNAQMEAPFESTGVVYSIDQLPYNHSAAVTTRLYVLFVLFMIGGSYFIYRLVLTQLRLAEERTNFISAVSHELKTPITAIRMYAEMLINGWTKDEDKKMEHYKYICSESERLSRLINNVLDFARASKQNSLFELEPLSLSEVLKLIETTNYEKISGSGFKLNKVNQPGATENDIVINSNKDALSQIFINLIDNAIKFSKNCGNQIIDLGFKLDANSNSLTIFVRDYGNGIPEEQHSKIFNLFYRPENELTRTTTGTGIGLALVMELAKSIGAEVNVRNTKPGAEFSLIFKFDPRCRKVT